PLPILIVALGWSHWAGLIAALTAAGGLAGVFSSYLFLAFLLGIGLPAWWLSYLTLLARPVQTAAGPRLEWYPIGRLIIWVAVISAAIVVAVLFTLGDTDESIRAELRRPFEPLFRDIPDASRRVEALVAAAPPAAAISVTLINLISLWLAASIVKVSN